MFVICGRQRIFERYSGFEVLRGTGPCATWIAFVAVSTTANSLLYLKVGCVATAHALLLAYVNVNFAFTRKGESNIGWPVELSEAPAGQLTYM